MMQSLQPMQSNLDFNNIEDSYSQLLSDRNSQYSHMTKIDKPQQSLHQVPPNVGTHLMPRGIASNQDRMQPPPPQKIHTLSILLIPIFLKFNGLPS